MKIVKKIILKIETKNEIRKIRGVIKSLKDYDEGKKQISTANIERCLPNIRVTSGR